MPLPPFVVKGTIFFELGGNGFTESFWWVGLTADLSAHSAYLLNVVNKRRVLLGKEASIHAYRVSFESGVGGAPVLGDSYLQYYNQAGFSSEIADFATTALLCTWKDATFQRRKQQFMRGIWDNVVSNGGSYIPSYGTWQTKFDAWRGAISAAVPGVKGPGAGWVQRVPINGNIITNYTSDADSYVTFTTLGVIPNVPQVLPAIGEPRNTPLMIRITKLNTRSVLNGQRLITVLDDHTMRTTQPIAAGAFKLAGKFVFYDLNFREAGTNPADGLISITGEKIVERKVGTPLLELRGRRKAAPKV
jgi:hypothetical protein